MRHGEGTILLIGYGNPGRQDDGLGPALAGAVERMAIAGVTVEAAYQLSVEDAAAVAEHDVVVLADAARCGPSVFSFGRIEPEVRSSFSSHSVSPGALLGLAEELFGAKTNGYLLGIRGYAFDAFGEWLSPASARNLAAAVAFIEPVLRERRWVTDGEVHERAR